VTRQFLCDTVLSFCIQASSTLYLVCHCLLVGFAYVFVDLQCICSQITPANFLSFVCLTMSTVMKLLLLLVCDVLSLQFLFLFTTIMILVNAFCAFCFVPVFVH